MSSFKEKFNQTFSEFMEDIIRVFPNDSDFRMYHIALQTALMLDESIVQEVFHEKVVIPYGDKILARDNSFFLTHDYSDVKSEYKQANEVIEKIKTAWVSMSTDNQEVVWKYFKVLVLLDQKISKQ